MICSLVACNSPETTKKTLLNIDKITKNVFTDRYGDKMEVAINSTKKIVDISLYGKRHTLKQNKTTSGVSASNDTYEYTKTANEVTFLKKDIDVVLFHLIKSTENGKIMPH
ncbi:hypothetical protein [Chryseobacterium sp. ERMR1:04]|uniref:hypothetical protein n=1 Tax=Chryseobacterium sp. ERMR1:04 TaxID=1705393 RepID=UPI0006C88F8B|nr:hypothetical protein [Chryseobacterium sp. ERMR1:04]KPH14163.1 hypothetical protein AMQ68_01145 [Chryseobacterium sp. ERMR1:04]